MLSAGGQCGDVVGKLEGRVELVGLAEGGPGGLVVARLIAGQGTGVITNLNAGVLSQAEGLQILPEGVHAHSVSHLREEVVAGLGDGLRHIDETVVAAGAVGAAVGGVVGIDPPAGRVDLLGGSNDPLLQRGHGRQGLDGGAGDVRPVGGAVCEGAGRVIVESRVDAALSECGEIIGGIRGQGQNFPRAHLYHRHGAAPGLIPILPGHPGDGGGQGVLRRLLEVQVDGQLHGVAGHRLLGVILAGDLAVLVQGDHPGAVGALEMGFKGRLHAVLAHIVVPVISLAQGLLFRTVVDFPRYPRICAP